MSLEHFALVDSTLREGEQFSHANFSTADKKEIARALSGFGIEYIELTSPCASSGSRKDCETIAMMGLPSTILTHIRCRRDDAKMAIETGVDGVSFFLKPAAFSDPSPVDWERQDFLEPVLEILGYTREQAPDIEIRFSLEDVFRAPLEQVFRLYQRVEQSGFVDRLGIADTVGIALPSQVEDMVRLFRSISGRQIEFHGHNDTECAVANSYTALKAGATHIDTSVLGLGERNGITSLAGFIARMYSLQKELIKDKYRLERLKPLHELVARKVGLPIPWNHPVVGEAAFVHKAGTHTNSILKDPTSYEILDPEDFSALRTILIAHKLTGWHSIKARAQKLGLCIDEQKIKALSSRIKQAADEETLTMKQLDDFLISGLQAEGKG